ncbi:MAG: hypothetical protein ACYDAG_08945, partial [Chloroflexota bacterium]
MVGEAPPPSVAATAAERAAADRVIGRFPDFERSLLLPVLRDLQAETAHLSKGLLGYLGERLRIPFSDLCGVASF